VIVLFEKNITRRSKLAGTPQVVPWTIQVTVKSYKSPYLLKSILLLIVVLSVSAAPPTVIIYIGKFLVSFGHSATF
jgi:hypothetical protein